MQYWQNQGGNHSGFFTGHSGCGSNMDAMLPSRFKEERLGFLILKIFLSSMCALASFR